MVAPDGEVGHRSQPETEIWDTERGFALLESASARLLSLLTDWRARWSRSFHWHWSGGRRKKSDRKIESRGGGGQERLADRQTDDRKMALGCLVGAGDTKGLVQVEPEGSEADGEGRGRWRRWRSPGARRPGPAPAPGDVATPFLL